MTATAVAAALFFRVVVIVCAAAVLWRRETETLQRQLGTHARLGKFDLGEDLCPQRGRLPAS